jgi:hypothetical protein
VHESGEYETNEDYRLNEVHRFEDLNDVAAFLQDLNFSLDCLQNSKEIDAP